MFSYLKRLESFESWRESDPVLIKKLALIGQYSIDAKQKKTVCYYCDTLHSKWAEDDVPLQVHYSENEQCPLFRIALINGRKELSVRRKDGRSCKSMAKELDPNVTCVLERKFVQFNIDNRNLFFCAVCGNTDLSHSCEIKVQKFKEYVDIESSQFYIQYLHGFYLERIDEYLKNRVDIKEEAKSTVRYCLDVVLKCNDMIKFESFLEMCSERLFLEVEKKIKQIEKDEIDSMYAESIIL